MSFDTLAPYYRTMEFVSAGGIMQRCRTAFLAEAVHCRRALLLGEGPGRFLVELLRANPRVEVTCVERSPRMIQEARHELARNGLDSTRVRFEQADALAWQPLARPRSTNSSLAGSPCCSDSDRVAAGGMEAPLNAARTTQRTVPIHVGFDLIVTHFFLDCFRREELEELVAKVAAAATDQARWLLSDFRVPERGWRRWRARVALALMYGFFRFATGLSATRLTPPDGFLEAAGFRRADRRLANFGLTYSDLWLKSNS